MKTKHILLAIAVTLAIATPAAAGPPVMIKDWNNDCNASMKTTEGFIKQMICLRYARGVADGLSLWQILDSNSALICIPHTVDAKQLVEVGKKYFRENPKDQHIDAGTFLGLAFRDAWPCETANPTVNFK